MANKVNLLLIMMLMIFHACPISADIATPSDYYDGGVSASIEGILSLEKHFSSKSSFLIWSGGALVHSISHQSSNGFDPTYGVEASLEFRFYFTGDERNRFFVGLYTGIGYIKGPRPYHHWYHTDEYETYFIQSFGAKIGYKMIAINRSYDSSSLRLAIEPYLSGSLTYYYESYSGADGQSIVWNAPWLNLGLRIVFEYCLK